ncbi:MAG: molybdopterin molybdenumtransferase MoeA [Azospirillum sp.]|nr:molybdopterin molybdenumtransferase MoeA [Azospirillum sp.]
MIPVAEAVKRMCSAFGPLPGETVGLSEALGRVLAEPVVARVSHPPCNVSAMDGYAVRAADLKRLPLRVRKIGEVAAGGMFRGMVGPGETVRVFTGAPMPGGTTAVVMQEYADAEGDFVILKQQVAAGDYVRPTGLDFKLGHVGLPAGRRLTARDIALAAAMNVPWLRVRRKPRIAILSTGDEVVMPGDAVGSNQVVSANGPGLAALVTACGGLPLSLGIARDTPESLAACAAGATGTDLLVTSGGASVGDHDLVREVLGERGVKIDFWKVAMRPGKPVMFGTTGTVPLLGLPGNPVSSLVSAIVFLIPILRVLQGQPAGETLPEMARLGAPLDVNGPRHSYLRATLARDVAGDLVATPFPQQDSAMLSRLAWADCLIVRGPGLAAATVGDRVEIIRFGTGCLGL